MYVQTGRQQRRQAHQTRINSSERRESWTRREGPKLIDYIGSVFGSESFKTKLKVKQQRCLMSCVSFIAVGSRLFFCVFLSLVHRLLRASRSNCTKNPQSLAS